MLHFNSSSFGEKSAYHRQTWQPTIIYGLLQITPYVKSIYYALDTFVGDDDLESFIKARLARQALLLQNSSLQIEVLLTEAAFRTAFLSADDTVLQIRHIIRLTEASFIELGILPLSTRPAVIPFSGWEI